MVGIQPGSFSEKYADFLAFVESTDRSKLALQIAAAVEKGTELETRFHIVRKSDGAARLIEMRLAARAAAAGRRHLLLTGFIQKLHSLETKT